MSRWNWSCDLTANEKPQNKLHERGQTDRYMDIATNRPKGPKGRFGENVAIHKTAIYQPTLKPYPVQFVLLKTALNKAKMYYTTVHLNN